MTKFISFFLLLFISGCATNGSFLIGDDTKILKPEVDNAIFSDLFVVWSKCVKSSVVDIDFDNINYEDKVRALGLSVNPESENLLTFSHRVLTPVADQVKVLSTLRDDSCVASRIYIVGDYSLTPVSPINKGVLQ